MKAQDTRGDILSKRKDVNILIVENNLFDAGIAEKMLHLLNYHHTFIANTGKEAVELSSKMPFSLVILGTDLPDMNEIEICHQLRSIFSDKNIPIIAYTDFAKESKPKILNNFFDGFLFKLMGAEDFIRVIERCVKRNRVGAVSCELS